MKKMSTNEVFEIIYKEREYQEEGKKKIESHIVEDFNLGDALSAIDYNLDMARQEWYKGKTPHQNSMEYLRKIAAICVQMGETYGMSERM